jgi:hypothetical protein
MSNLNDTQRKEIVNQMKILKSSPSWMILSESLKERQNDLKEKLLEVNSDANRQLYTEHDRIRDSIRMIENFCNAPEAIEKLYEPAIEVK